MKKLIVLVFIGAMFTNANAEEKTQSQRLGEVFGKSLYNSTKGILSGMGGQIRKDITEITKEPETKKQAINTIIVNGKRKTYLGGELIKIEEVK